MSSANRFEEFSCSLILPSLNPKNILGIFVTSSEEVHGTLESERLSCVLAGC